ncbi:hypothetical protein GGI43DRAFT_407447 [Trichoderma evansii]
MLPFPATASSTELQALILSSLLAALQLKLANPLRLVLFSLFPFYSLFSLHAPLHLFLSCRVFFFSLALLFMPTPSHANSVRTARRPSLPSIFPKIPILPLDCCSSPHQPEKEKRALRQQGKGKKPQRQRPFQPFASQ